MIHEDVTIPDEMAHLAEISQVSRLYESNGRSDVCGGHGPRCYVSLGPDARWGDARPYLATTQSTGPDDQRALGAGCVAWMGLGEALWQSPAQWGSSG